MRNFQRAVVAVLAFVFLALTLGVPMFVNGVNQGGTFGLVSGDQAPRVMQIAVKFLFWCEAERSPARRQQWRRASKAECWESLFP